MRSSAVIGSTNIASICAGQCDRCVQHPDKKTVQTVGIRETTAGLVQPSHRRGLIYTKLHRGREVACPTSQRPRIDRSRRPIGILVLHLLEGTDKIAHLSVTAITT